MKDHLLFFYPASVSKSLLIVLGTLSLPAKNDREKYRIAGIPKHSRNAWTTRRTRVVHPFHRPCISFIDLPALLLDAVHAETARAVRTHPPSPLSCFSESVSAIFPTRLLYACLPHLFDFGLGSCNSTLVGFFGLKNTIQKFSLRRDEGRRARLAQYLDRLPAGTTTELLLLDGRGWLSLKRKCGRRGKNCTVGERWRARFAPASSTLRFPYVRMRPSSQLIKGCLL